MFYLEILTSEKVELEVAIMPEMEGFTRREIKQLAPKLDQAVPSIRWMVAAGRPFPGGPTSAPSGDPSTT